MNNRLWKTCVGGFVAAVFCAAAGSQSYGASTKSLEEMEKELNALRASVSALTDQIESVKQEKEVVVSSSDTNKEVEALRNEVSTLKEEMRTAANAETLKAEDIAGNVYSEFAKKVKLGGQIRTRAEYSNGYYQVPTSNNTLLGGAGAPTVGALGRDGGDDDDYVLNQTRLWADADVNEHLRMFIQIQDARTFGAEGTTVGQAVPATYTAGTANVENSITDLHQGYFDLRKLFDLPLTVRVGRQEIIWGDHRVLGNFVWSNVGRTFDAGRFMWDTDEVHIEAIAARVDEDGYTTNDGSDNSDENMYAAQFAFKKLIPSALLELMYIQRNDEDNVANLSVLQGFDTAASSESLEVHDFGFRLDGKIPNLDAIDYTLEAHGQFGDYGDQTHKAYALAAKGGYTFKEMNWKPRFGFEYAHASGDDDPTDSDHDTFDNLYPTNHMNGIYGFADLLSWQNMHDIRFNVKVTPTQKLTAQVDYHYFLLDEAEDGWYLANGFLASGTRPAAAIGYDDDDRELAQEVDLTVSYQLYKNVGILGGYSWFGAGDWIKNNGGDSDDTNWVYLQTTVTF